MLELDDSIYNSSLCLYDDTIVLSGVFKQWAKHRFVIDDLQEFL